LFETDADCPFYLAFFLAFRPAKRTPLVCRSITRCAPRLCSSRLMCVFVFERAPKALQFED
jgi:hypothetical protein